MLDLSTWVGIVGVLTTLAVGLPVYWLKRDDRAAGGPTSDGLTVHQHVNISHRQTQQTHHHYSTGSAESVDEAWAYLGLTLAAGALYWAWRPYLLVAMGALAVGCAVLTWAGQRWARIVGDCCETPLLLVAFAVVGANSLLLVYPGRFGATASV